ncbi:hypothetical protein POTOM_058526 [Populus tomentosa]|uniref:Uncharacterized protein n=1 Tax=Populus tomentosa TaxID=118781 RepID=A0A8X7XZ01_POPTO|nr:hypothetical protein POTOM_058526 [Populus tomentosa]
MMKLNVLSFSNNLLLGSIPATVENLSNLSVLNLANNRLSGSIPPELGRLKSLSELRLNLNDLTGAIPASIGDLIGLKVSQELSISRLDISSSPWHALTLGELVNLDLQVEEP